MSQKTFSDIAWERKEKKTRREEFLSEMERVVPWKEFERLLRPYAPRPVPGEVGGCPAHPVSVMLRMYFCQNWYQLSDEGIEAMHAQELLIHDMATKKEAAGLGYGSLALELLEAIAKAESCFRIFVQTRHAAGFYERNGYSVYSTGLIKMTKF